MFSPRREPSAASEGPLNPARKRTRQTTSRPSSRPTSRTTRRHERSESDASSTSRMDISAPVTRASSVAVASEASNLRRAANGHPHKEHNSGEVEWTKNDKYRVSKLLALPPIFKTFTVNDTPVTAATESIHGYALMLSHNSAYCWRYTTPHALPHTYSFPLPTDEAPGTNLSTLPFPLGTIVSPSANSKEPGLVVVMPMTGRVAYWDSIGSAVAEGLFTKKRGVEGQVPIFSGESVTAICSAEPAGFILSLSSGRLAHLALRDAAGRPGVNVTILRGNGTGIMSGFLGALRAGSSRRDVVAVRAGKELRMGEREIIVGTARANFSRWHVNRNGVYANVADLDLREEILSSVERADQHQGRSRDGFVVLDMDIAGYVGSPNEEDLDIVVLGMYMPDATWGTALYVKLDITLTANGRAYVKDVYPIKTYTNPLDSASRVKPRLYLPKPGKTAFVVFPRAVVIISSEDVPPSDDDEMEESHRQYFEDVVDFRQDFSVSIVGGGSEDIVTGNRSFNGGSVAGSFAEGSFGSQDQISSQVERLKNPGVVLVAKGAGIIRIEAFDIQTNTRKPQQPVTVKSKLEQAVFYGIKEDNPLNFKGRKEIKYDTDKLEDAALQLSKEIIGTANPFQPTLASSLSEHLKGRAIYLKALIEYLQSDGFGQVSREARWQLLSDAEKLEAARAVYSVWDKRREEDSEVDDGLLEHILEEHLPLEQDKVVGDDPVRTWFTREIDNIGSLLPFVKKSLVHQLGNKKNHIAVASTDAEANDIIIAALMAAWKFRVRSADLYGIKSINENGLFTESAGVHAPWTSAPSILQALSDQHEISITLLQSIINTKLNEDPARLAIAEKISGQLVELAEICCRSFEERADWCDQQPASNDGIHLEGQTVRERYLASRGSWIKPVVTYNHKALAYKIAEKWRDFQTLVEICWESMVAAESVLADIQKHAPEDVNAAKAEKEEITNRLTRYFNTFGQPFAETMYTYLIATHQLRKLLDGFGQWRDQYLTPFLRSSPLYAKLAWINDIHHRDYLRASSTLTTVADLDPHLAHRKIALSISKLSLLAGNPHADTTPHDAALSITTLQIRLHTAVAPYLRSALDTSAAIQLATESLGAHLSNRPFLLSQFQRDIAKLHTNQALPAADLADLLSLIHCPDDPSWFDGRQFYTALNLLHTAGGLAAPLRSALERAVWRRCYTADNWPALAATRGKSDRAVRENTHRTALYRTLRLGFENGLFARDGAPGTTWPLRPDDALFDESIDQVLGRYKGEVEPAGLEDVAADWRMESRLLRECARGDVTGWFDAFMAELERGKVEEEEDEEEEDGVMVGGESHVEDETMMEGESMLDDSVVYGEETTRYEEDSVMYEEGDTMMDDDVA